MRISEKFEELRSRSESALIPYISVGDPNSEETIKIAEELIEAGADIIEFGLPFSDPIADGPTIQAASQRALEKGMNTDEYFKTVKKIPNTIPKVCMTYYNLLVQYGIDKFCKKCLDAGISGLIIPDLPIEESAELMKITDNRKIDLIYIVSPKTSGKRLERICRDGRGFIYLQSVLGVTGAREEISSKVFEKLKDIRRFTDLPVAIGFGVSKPEQVRNLVIGGFDGVIVGSAIIRAIDTERIYVKDFVRALKEKTKP